MYYYQVLVATKNQLNNYLTYSSVKKIALHTVILVPVKKKLYKGIIVEKTNIIENDTIEYREIVAISNFKLPLKLVKSAFKFHQESSLNMSGIANLILSNALLEKLDKLILNPIIEDQIPPKLTSFQKDAYNKLVSYKKSKPQLLLGINGSGKTRIYAQLISETLNKNKSCLILAPEIGLGKQILNLLTTYLPKIKLYNFHSQLTPKQKQSLWQQVNISKEALVVIGPRSAEFLPFKNLGLIILDEFHDNSYNQSNFPNYHSLQFAHILAQTHRAKLVCGSATPKIEDYYHFKKANYPIINLKHKALEVKHKPNVVIANNQDSTQIFKDETFKIIINSLKNGHQVLIFYNRRGNWRSIKCYNCHFQASCNNCSNNLVFHKDKFKLICHKCGTSSKPLSSCPKCHKALNYNVAGIKTIVKELENKLLNVSLRVPIWRFDSDNLKKEALFTKIKQINQEKELVIIGTQIVNQGLDLINLQTVVIVDAEQSLVAPDYRSDEKYYQQIHQLGGRVGRGHISKTNIVIQTDKPDRQIIKYALEHNWQNFYNHEIKNRKAHHLPPFSHLANISIRHSNKDTALKEALKLYNKLKQENKNIKCYQPAPALIFKQGKSYEYLIHASSSNRSQLLKLAHTLKESRFFIHLNPNNLFD